MTLPLRTRLDEICTFKYGQMPTHTDLTDEGYPVFSGYRIVGRAKTYHYAEPEIVVVARGVGGTGDVKMSPPFCFLTNLSIAVRVNSSKVYKPFLYYRLASTKLWELRTGSAQAQITIERLRQYEVELPPIPIQRRVVEIVAAYDDLIENNLRRIRILEEMARSLYREWFVNFRFPGHERVAQVESLAGPIPEGWHLKKLTECVDLNPRVVIARDVDIPFVPMGCLSNDSMLISGVESRQNASGAKFQNGDSLFARITPCLENGKTAFVQFLPEPDATACGSTEFIVMRSRTLTPEFVYLLARSDELREHAIKSMTGASGRQRVQEHCFDQFFVAEPQSAVLDSFTNFVHPAFQWIQQLHLQSENLRRTRDLLLPRLLSGKINLDDVEPAA